MEQIDELTHRWLEGRLSAEDEACLASLCDQQPAARKQHLGLLRMESALRGLSPAPDVSEVIVAQLEQSQVDYLERTVMHAIAELPQPAWAAQRSWRRIGLGLACCLPILAAATGIVWWQSVDHRPFANAPLLAGFSERVEVLDGANVSHSAASRSVQWGDTVVAHEDDHALLAFPDGTTVELFGPSKLLVVSDSGMQKRLKLLEGSMHLDVRPQPAGLPMIVATPQGEARVLGTRFRLATGVERTRIEMEEGNVAFRHRVDGRTVEVAKGAYFVVDETPADVAIQPLPPTLVAPLWSRSKTGNALAMSASGAQIAVGLRSNGLLILDCGTGDVQAEWPSADVPARLAFSYADQRLVALSTRSQASAWNLVEGRQQPLQLAGDVGPLRAISADGRLCGITLGNGWQPKVRLWRLPDDALAEGGLPELVRDADGKNDTWSATFSRSGALVALGTRIGWMHVEEVDTGLERWRQRMGTEYIRQLALSPDERWLAAYSAGLGIQLWSLESNALAATWLPEGPAARSLVFSPDSRQLAVGLADRTVRFWSIPDGRSTLLIETGRGGAEQIAFAPDGRLLATSGQDTAVWELP